MLSNEQISYHAWIVLLGCFDLQFILPGLCSVLTYLSFGCWNNVQEDKLDFVNKTGRVFLILSNSVLGTKMCSDWLDLVSVPWKQYSGKLGYHHNLSPLPVSFQEWKWVELQLSHHKQTTCPESRQMYPVSGINITQGYLLPLFQLVEMLVDFFGFVVITKPLW